MKVGDSVAQPGYPPLEFCSPERLYGKDPSFACDMWSYMIISFIYQGHPPFHGWFRDEVLTTTTVFLGLLPERWKGSYIYADGQDSWYDQNQTPSTKKSIASEFARLSTRCRSGWTRTCALRYAEGIYILTRGASDCNITSGRSFIQSSYGQIWVLIVWYELWPDGLCSFISGLRPSILGYLQRKSWTFNSLPNTLF